MNVVSIKVFFWFREGRLVNGCHKTGIDIASSPKNSAQGGP